MTKQKLAEAHQKMVATLAKKGDKILEALSPVKCHLMHMIVGIMDEYFELQVAIKKADRENILEECGDMLFYTEGLLIDVELDHPYNLKVLGEDETFQALARIGKRHVFYNQELDNKELICVYNNLKSWIGFYLSQIGKTIADAQEHNMAKLAVRYKNFQYSDERAKQRVDKGNQDDVPLHLADS
jgi:phosphoribosyl-ATP pyrophosphohydrolase